MSSASLVSVQLLTVGSFPLLPNPHVEQNIDASTFSISFPSPAVVIIIALPLSIPQSRKSPGKKKTAWQKYLDTGFRDS